MSQILDDLAPAYLREARIVLQLDTSTPTARAFQPVLIRVSYDLAKPEGVRFPLILDIRGPSAARYDSRVFYAKPTRLVFVPREGGVHMLSLREAAHNLWFGSLRLPVEGESLAPLKAV